MMPVPRSQPSEARGETISWAIWLNHPQTHPHTPTLGSRSHLLPGHPPAPRNSRLAVFCRGEQSKQQRREKRTQQPGHVQAWRADSPRCRTGVNLLELPPWESRGRENAPRAGLLRMNSRVQSNGKDRRRGRQTQTGKEERQQKTEHYFLVKYLFSGLPQSAAY